MEEKSLDSDQARLRTKLAIFRQGDLARSFVDLSDINQLFVVMLKKALIIILGILMVSHVGFYFAKSEVFWVLLFILNIGLMIVVFQAVSSRFLKITNIYNEKESQIKRRNSQYSALIASIGDGIISTDKTGKVEFVNEAALSILGYRTITDLENVIDKPVDSLFSLFDENNKQVDKKYRPLYQTLSTGLKSDTSKTAGGFQIKRRDDSMVPVNILATPIKLGTDITGAVLLLRDMTWQKEIDQAKNEFVSLASHQLRTPLTTIKWYLEMINESMSNKMTDDEKKMHDKVYQGAEEMRELVTALLDVSRLELGNLAMNFNKLNLGRLIEAISSSVEPQLKLKNINFFKVIPEADIEVETDTKFFSIVIENLLTNAIKYTEDGGDVSIVVEKVYKDQSKYGEKYLNDGVVIYVEDNGYGIPEKQQSQIFSKMFRAENVQRKEVNGTGLGLHMVRLIVKKLFGEVWFKSIENQGSTFYVYIPLINENNNKKGKYE